MNSVQSSLPSFIEALESEQQVEISASGSWKKTSTISRVINSVCCFFGIKVFGYGIDSNVELARSFAQTLSSWNINVHHENIIGISAPATEQLEQIESAARLIKERLLNTIKRNKEKFKELQTQITLAESEGNTEKAERLESEFEAQYAKAGAYKAYRSIKENIHRFKNLSKPLEAHKQNTQHPEFEKNCKRVTNWLKTWQKRQFPNIDFLPLEGTQQKIEALSRFHSFVKDMKKNPLLKNQFFDSAFKNISYKNIDAVYTEILAPSTRKELAKTYMDKRMWYYNQPNDLKLRSYTILNKPIYSISIPINGQDAQITDLKHIIEVAPGENKTVSEFFKYLKKQNEGIIPYEYIKDKGICKLDISLENADLDKETWWKDIPDIEVLSRDEISEKFGITLSQSMRSFMAVCATREHKPLHDETVGEIDNAINNHAFMIVALPREDGKFNITYLGKWAKSFPVGILETIKHIFTTHIAKLTLIDFNRSMNNRERIINPIPLNNERFDRFMQLLARDFKLSREGKLIFQGQGDNCAGWVQRILNDLYSEIEVPQVFDRPFINMTAPFPVSLIRDAREFFPEGDHGVSLWNSFRVGLAGLLGAHETVKTPAENGDESHSLMSNKKWRDGRIHIPAHLFRSTDAFDILRNVDAREPASSLQ